MPSKYYVVWKGRKPGVYRTWAECQAQVNKFAGAKFKSFPTAEEAEAAFNGGPAAPSNAGSAAVPAKRERSSRRGTSSVRRLDAQGIDELEQDVRIFTDGGCEPNPGEAGSGIAVYHGDELVELWYGLYNQNGTNNTAELGALYRALEMAHKLTDAGKSVAILCDSKYSIQCITEWAFGWEKKGWKRGNQEVKNLDLIKPMFALYKLLKDKIAVFHVYGHSSIEGNELADRMSMVAIEAREKAFRRYEEPLDVERILALRRG